MNTYTNVSRKSKGRVLLVLGLLTVLLAVPVFTQQILWIRQFGTPALDWARGVALDGTGNIYVVGLTGGVLPGQARLGDADDSDAFVVKLR